MTGVSIRLDGADATLAVLGDLVKRTQNPRGLFENLGDYLAASTQRRFETGTAPGGAKWPLSIRAKVEGGKTLVDTGRLSDSIVQETTDHSVAIGTDVVHAAIHQLGGTIKPKTKKALRFKIGKAWVTAKQVTIPARPFLGIDGDDETEIINIAENWLRGEANAV